MKHTHRYHRINIGRKPKEYWVMACNLSGCKHYTPMATKLSAPLLVGDIAICNKCNEPFELSRSSLRAAKPICDGCTNSKDKVIIKKAEDFFDKLQKELGK